MSIIEAFGWTIATQFQRHPQGYLYRQDRKGRPILVSASERDGFVRVFGWKFLAHVAGFMVAVIAAAMLTARFYPKGDETGGFFLMGGLLLVIGIVLFKSVKWALHAPTRVLADRATFA
ncbi:MAG: hypothetical protein JWQ58_3700 [Reyranella sp.]|nr:hypothetical protein [Reyranella sp.]